MSEPSAHREDEARGRDLLAVAEAWPLGRRLASSSALSRQVLPLLTWLLRKERFAFFVAHDFQPDRLSAWVVARNEHRETYAATFKVKSDHDLPGDVLDAVKHNHTPQFNLRNIGRLERSDVNPAAPLPFVFADSERRAAREAIDEVRASSIPKVEPIEVWSLRMVTTVRRSLRRLLIEDPWEHRYGAEVRANFAGRAHDFVVEGTHPDDLPDAWWGPAPIPVPTTWAAPPPGAEREERATSLHDVIRVVSAGSG